MTYIWGVIRFSKKMANWIVLNCENCKCHELERLGSPKRYKEDGVYVFEQAYKCKSCGFIGKITQRWKPDGRN